MHHHKITTIMGKYPSLLFSRSLCKNSTKKTTWFPKKNGQFRMMSIAPGNRDENNDIPTDSLGLFSSDTTTESITMVSDHIPTLASSVSSSSVDAAISLTQSPFNDLGYSPVDIAIRAFESIHTTTGLPWWLTLASGTVALRFLLAPLTIDSMRNASRMKAVRPELEKTVEAMKAENDPTKMLLHRRKMKSIYKKHGISMWKILLPFAQLPPFISCFLGIRRMCESEPSFITGGNFWFTDLSAADPLIILPVISGLTMLAAMELTPMTGLGKDMERKAKLAVRVISFAAIPMTMHLPSGVFIYIVTSGVFSLGQTLILNVPGVKTRLGIEEKKNESNTVFSTALRDINSKEDGRFLETFQNRPVKKAN